MPKAKGKSVRNSKGTRTRVVSESKKMTKVLTTKRGAKQDKRVAALPPGKRISANGNVYTEKRSNRSDKKK